MNINRENLEADIPVPSEVFQNYHFQGTLFPTNIPLDEFVLRKISAPLRVSDTFDVVVNVSAQKTTVRSVCVRCIRETQTLQNFE